MKLLAVGVALTFACVAGSASAYTIKTYHGLGASRIQACTLANRVRNLPMRKSLTGG